MTKEELIKALRKPANWQAQDKGQEWKGATSRYDRTPFEAADFIEKYCLVDSDFEKSFAISDATSKLQ